MPERAVQRENSRDLQKVPFRYLTNYWSDSCEKTLPKAEQRTMDNNPSLWCVWWLLSSLFFVAIDSLDCSPSSLSDSFFGPCPYLDGFKLCSISLDAYRHTSVWKTHSLAHSVDGSAVCSKYDPFSLWIIPLEHSLFRILRNKSNTGSLCSSSFSR